MNDHETMGSRRAFPVGATQGRPHDQAPWRLAARSRGQAAFEALAITLVLVAGFWGLRWMHGQNGALAALVQALRLWHERFATLLALPV